MSRVDELAQKYPSVPREMIVRIDAGTHGVRDSGKMDEQGEWVRMAASGTYAYYGHDLSLKDWVTAQPGRQKPGQFLRPGRFAIPENGMPFGPNINTKSDLEIRNEGSGKFALYQGDERVQELLYRPSKVKKEYLTSAGTPTTNFIQQNYKNCFFIAPVRHCEYFPLGVACKFCNFNPTQDDARSIGLERSTTVSVEETLEAYKIHAAENTIIEGRFELGGFTKSENETRIHATFIEKLASATPHKPNFSIYTQPMDRKQMQRLKDAGLDSPGFQMEIWDPELFAEVVPGKAQYTGRDRYLEAFEEAVDVFGAGNMACVFVGGLGMIPEKGHKTWQESRDSMIEGITWMEKRGITTQVTNLRLPPGSTYGSDENRQKAPPTDYYVEVLLAQYEIGKEYGLWEKMNRLMWCPLDCFALPTQLAALELAGSFGNWAAAVVPREANWHLDWEEQRKSAVETK